MKKLSLFLLVSVFAFCGCSDSDDETKDGDKKKEIVVNFENLLTKAETLYLGDTENPAESWEQGNTPYYLTYLLDNTKAFEFDCVSSSYGFGMDAFGFTNFTSGNYSAVPKKGVKNNTYIIVGASGYKIGANNDKEAAIRFKDNNNSNNKKAYQVKGLFITNCMYAYNSMKEGTDYFHEHGEEDKFDSNDSFKVIIYNIDKTKKVEYYLAQGTNLVDEWKWVNLTSLGKTEGLKFELQTTKNNDWGAMTPTYFCLDGITLIEDVN